MEKKKKLKGLIIIPLLVVIILAVIGILGVSLINPHKGEITTVSEASLQDVLKISELSTIENTYNAVTKVYDESGSVWKYSVSYEGIVKAGIDFEEIEITFDEENKKITVTIPQVKIIETIVDEGTLKYIFQKEKYNTATVSAEAYKKCLEDISTRANQETVLLEMAQENTISAVKGLIEPWVEQLDGEYTVEVR